MKYIFILFVSAISLMSCANLIKMTRSNYKSITLYVLPKYMQTRYGLSAEEVKGHSKHIQINVKVKSQFSEYISDEANFIGNEVSGYDSIDTRLVVEVELYDGSMNQYSFSATDLVRNEKSERVLSLKNDSKFYSYINKLIPNEYKWE